MFDMFPIRNVLKQGDALSPLLFNFALEYAFRRDQVHQDIFKLNITHQLLDYVDDVNTSILRGRVHTIKENAESTVVASKENRLEVNADKTKYMVISRDQNSGRSHNIKIDNSSFDRVEEFKYEYLGTTLRDQNYIQEEIKNRSRPGNACYHLVQNLLSSSLLSKNLNINIYRPIIFPVVFYGCETWSLTLREKRRLRVCVRIGC